MKKIEGSYMIELTKNYRNLIKCFDIINEQYVTYCDPSDG